MKESSESKHKQSSETAITNGLYNELRKIAGAKMRNERGNHTLRPTALVNEAYLRLANQPDLFSKSRSQVLACAALAMRHVLVDYARARAAGKRGAGIIQVTFDEQFKQDSGELIDILAVDEALTQLEKLDPREATVVELHFFSGLSFEEIAERLGISTRTAKSDWAMARAWMHGQFKKAHPMMDV